MRGLGAQGRRLPLRRPRPASVWAAAARAARSARCRHSRPEPRQLGRDRRDLVGQPRQPLVVLAHRMFQRMSPRAQLGERRRELVAGFLRGLQGRFGLRDALIDAGAPLLVGRALALQRVRFGGEPRPARRSHRRPSGARARCRHRAEGACGRARPCVPWRAPPRARVSRAPTVSRCSAAAALASASRSAGSSAAASAWCLDASACSPVRSATTRTARSWPARRRRARHWRRSSADGTAWPRPCAPAPRRAIADRLPRLLLEGIDLARELRDHVLEPQQVLLGRAQPQLGLVPARMQPGNAGGLLEHAPALLRLGLDDLADAALVHQGGRACAGRGIGEQNLHVAGAHLAAIDAIGRAGITLDPARHIEGIMLVELGRRLARAVVDLDRDLGVVAPRPLIGAGEDHVVHVGGAQGLVRGLAHHPAQRLDQVGLAAAVGSDHAGQPGLDHEIGGLDEGFEAEQPQSREPHANAVPKIEGRALTESVQGSSPGCGSRDSAASPAQNKSSRAIVQQKECVAGAGIAATARAGDPPGLPAEFRRRQKTLINPRDRRRLGGPAPRS